MRYKPGQRDADGRSDPLNGAIRSHGCTSPLANADAHGDADANGNATSNARARTRVRAAAARGALPPLRSAADAFPSDPV